MLITLSRRTALCQKSSWPVCKSQITPRFSGEMGLCFDLCLLFHLEGLIEIRHTAVGTVAGRHVKSCSCWHWFCIFMKPKLEIFLMLYRYK